MRKLFCAKFTVLSFIICLLTMLSATQVCATAAQRHILCTGINLGWAAARLELYGDNNPVQARLINESLNRAIEHIEMAATLFEIPYQSERRRWNVDQNVINRIRDYFGRVPRLNLNHKIGHIHNVWGMYRQSFQHTWDTHNLSEHESGYMEGSHYSPTCDLFILDAGYHLGRAHIASEIDGNRLRDYQVGANGMLWHAMRNGLNIALDGYAPGAPSQNDKKVCCSFGRPDDWKGAVGNLRYNSPPLEYHDANLTLQRITNDANVGCGGKSLTCPDGDKKDSHGNCVSKCPDRTRYDPSTGQCVPVHADDPFIRKGWTRLGRMNRFCKSELMCGGEIPECGPSNYGKVIQDRRTHNNCVAQGCEGGTQTITDRHGTYAADFDTYICKRRGNNEGDSGCHWIKQPLDPGYRYICYCSDIGAAPSERCRGMPLP